MTYLAAFEKKSFFAPELYRYYREGCLLYAVDFRGIRDMFNDMSHDKTYFLHISLKININNIKKARRQNMIFSYRHLEST